MKERGVYLYEADIDKQMYFKEDTVLSEVGHFHDSPELIFMLEGEIEAHSLNDFVHVKSGEICVIDSFECHYYKKVTENIRAIILVLSAEYVSLFRNTYKDSRFPMYLNKREKNKNIFELVQKWLSERNKTFMLNSGYANILFSYMLESYGLIVRKLDKNNMVLVSLLKYTCENFTKPVTLESIASKIGYSKEYCSKIFYEGVGLHFRDYLNYLRLKRADQLFLSQKDTKKTALEIIYDSGFNSAATYYRALKKGKGKNINF